MGRFRLVLAVLMSLVLFLCLAPRTGAQSSHAIIKPNEEKGEAAAGRVRAPRPRPKPRPAEIFLCETPDPSCRTTQDTFPIADLRDLFVFVVWPGVSGQHVQTVEFLLPDGSMYLSKKTRFTIGGTPVVAMVAAPKNEVAPTPPALHLMADANQVHAEGIPSLLMKSRGDSSVLTVLPVAGTYITQRNLSGTWRVRVLLDDRVVLESEFTLTPRASAPAAATQDEVER